MFFQHHEEHNYAFKEKVEENKRNPATSKDDDSDDNHVFVLNLFILVFII